MTRTVEYLSGVVDGAGINVLAGIGTASWPARQSVAYEVALEGCRQVVGWYTATIEAAEAEAEPDVEQLERLRTEQRIWVAEALALSPADAAGIRRVSDAGEALIGVPDDDGVPLAAQPGEADEDDLAGDSDASYAGDARPEHDDKHDDEGDGFGAGGGLDGGAEGWGDGRG
ncbi:hypothetical protein Kfla_6015 [Kribbella flavida DSM 17836]|uniref:Uncharacterized protein n=1 Tax=Kribbella flavida (strain DSM 17836 / JCM 10339 / NBRC 14399) TaxID=479435 RepID=D2PSW6_KRIFD|nr:hypothetical protein [Kribbella flavida]ADB35018.1 hypothetical protein Kfla_6015 [Kribbella flavida DSM 17836]